LGLYKLVGVVRNILSDSQGHRRRSSKGIKHIISDIADVGKPAILEDLQGAERAPIKSESVSRTTKCPSFEDVHGSINKA
jgi:hypothetical protein